MWAPKKDVLRTRGQKWPLQRRSHGGVLPIEVWEAAGEGRWKNRAKSNSFIEYAEVVGHGGVASAVSTKIKPTEIEVNMSADLLNLRPCPISSSYSSGFHSFSPASECICITIFPRLVSPGFHLLLSSALSLYNEQNCYLLIPLSIFCEDWKKLVLHANSFTLFSSPLSPFWIISPLLSTQNLTPPPLLSSSSG